jgi:hypothetical protein
LFRQKNSAESFYYQKPNSMATPKVRAEIIKTEHVGAVAVSSTRGKDFLNAKKSLLKPEKGFFLPIYR